MHLLAVIGVMMYDDCALAAGTRALAEQHRAERQATANAIQLAEDIFNANPEGMYESALIIRVKTELACKQVDAATAADRLRSRGFARMNWRTGFITHTTEKERGALLQR